MRNPIKAFKKAVKNVFGSKPAGRPQLPNPDYAELYVIWPDGTWNMSGTTGGWDYDNTMRGTLLDVWAYSRFYAAEQAAGYELNPGHFGTYPDPIPAGWRPTEKEIKLLWAKKKYSVPMLHYVIGQLSTMKMLAA